MTHDQYKELLNLSFFHDLNDDERDILERHLEGCGECRAESLALMKLNSILDSGRRPEVTDELVREARQELRVALRLERAKRSPLRDWLDRLNFLGYPMARVAFGGLATLVVGFSIGYMVFMPSANMGTTAAVSAAGETVADRTPPRVSNFRFVQQSPESNEVEFTFDMVTPIHMKGNINDVAVQRVMAQALMNEDNPGTRLLTVSALADRVGLTKTPDQDTKSALIQALKSDLNVGVRKEALRALERYPLDNELKSALLYVLRHESNPATRIEVINYLEKPALAHQLVDQDIVNVLKQTMQTDENNYIRIRAKNFIEEVKQQ